MDASIVIANWNGAKLLRKCLPPVIEAAARSGGDHEIIVVDDASEDDSVAVIEKEFPAVRLVKLPVNHGFAAACNKGVAESRNPVVVLLNTDMAVKEDFLSPLLAPFAASDVFAVAGRIEKLGGRTLEIGRTVGKFSLIFVKFIRSGEEGETGECLPTLAASGGASAFRREKYLKLGGFDRLYYPFYWEDADLSYRAWKRGWRVLYQPRSVVFHQHQGTIGAFFPQSYIKAIYYRNKFLFTWKNISDAGCLARHFLLLIPYLAAVTLLGKFHYLRGLWLALREIPAVLRRREEERRHRKRTDKEVFRLVFGRR